jgi:lambda repressor-like predicted transcriptional regulator
MGESLRVISEWLVSEGYGIGKDGVASHVAKHVGVDPAADGSDAASRSMLVAGIVGRVLQGWSHHAADIAKDLSRYGLTVEADVVQSGLPDSLRRALAATESTPAGELLASRCLARALSRVLSVRHPDAAREIAAELAKQGADTLADDLLWLADKATQHAADLATHDRQPEGEVSPGSGVCALRLPPT